MGCKASFCSPSLAMAGIAKIDKKNNAADRPSPADHGPQELCRASLGAWAAERVSGQAQVLNIMKDLQKERGLTCLFMRHNLAVVRHVNDSVSVMYPGRLVELADKQTLFFTPRHLYTRMLLGAIAKMPATGEPRTAVQGEVPNPLNPPRLRLQVLMSFG